ncbi:hypothetical protein ACFUJR_25855 [Streptomyces sp. NPDC057271]|uniref:hypothetical protein n=1 Tax=unclassified Streptomyces TaxID=2593676 RepID=UPI0036320FA2
MHDKRHRRSPENWFDAEDFVDQLLRDSGVHREGSLDSRAACEVLTLTVLLSAEHEHVCRWGIGPPDTGTALTRLRHKIRDDALWRSWCAGRITMVRCANDPAVAYAGRSWRWLTRERTVLADEARVQAVPDATACGHPALDGLSIWERGLLGARMALDSMLLAHAGAYDVIGSIVLVGRGASEGQLGVVLEAVWDSEDLLAGVARRVTSLRLALVDGSTAALPPRQLISLAELPAAS